MKIENPRDPDGPPTELDTSDPMKFGGGGPTGGPVVSFEDRPDNQQRQEQEGWNWGNAADYALFGAGVIGVVAIGVGLGWALAPAAATVTALGALGLTAFGMSDGKPDA